MPFEITLEPFAGPLPLLLELIDQEKLVITDVALVQVAEAYLNYLETHEVPADELADFLIVATKLLLLKSQAILPAAEPEAEDASKLADQLRLYQMFAEAATKLAKQYGTKPLFERARPAQDVKRSFVPPPDVTAESLHDAFENLLKRLEPFFALKQQSLERAVSVQQRMEEIRSALLVRSRFTFTEVLSEARSKVDAVVSFLALLELVKQRVVHAAQSDAFQDIMIRRVD